MAEESKDLNKDLQSILAAVDERGNEESDDRALRLSLAGKKARYMWYRLHDYPTKDLTPRNFVTFATGHKIHEWLQETLANYGSYNLLSVEGAVVDSFFEDSEGHYDILAEDSEGKKVLIEIKTTSQFQYVRLDPKNTKGGMWFSSRNFSFDPWSLLDSPFNYAWLYQVGSYLHEIQEVEEDIDRVVILVCNKNTGHLATATIGSDEFNRLYDLVDDRIQQWDKALEADSDKDLDYCWDMSDGVPLQCQYCDHIDNCLDYKITYEKGKPVFTLTS